MPRNQLTRDPSGIPSSRPLVPRGESLIAGHSAHRPFFLFAPSFLSLCISPALHKEISHQDRLETTIANSVDPLHPWICPSSCFSLSQSGSLQFSRRSRGILVSIWRPPESNLAWPLWGWGYSAS